MNFKGIKKVVLHSLGGDMDVARQIAEEIEGRGWDTEIPENGLCGSACTGIFQAGRRRHMHSTSFLMYHNASVEVLPNSSPIGKLVNGMASQVATGMGIDYLEKHGLSTQLRKDIQNAPAQSFHCIDSGEARGYNAATDLAGGPRVPSPAAGKGMLEEVPDSDGRSWTVPQDGHAYSSSTR
jgi:hypothetical protein